MSTGQQPTNSTPTPPLLSPREARTRTDLYIKQRLNYQADYYLNRIEEFKFNADRMLMYSAFLMGISTLVSALTVLANSAACALVTALLPAFAGGLAAFRSLYQWERQATIYESTWLALQRARIAMPDPDSIRTNDYPRFFPQLVEQTETVLRNEASQWGQLQNEKQVASNGQQTPPPVPPPDGMGGGEAEPSGG